MQYIKFIIVIIVIFYIKQKFKLLLSENEKNILFTKFNIKKVRLLTIIVKVLLLNLMKSNKYIARL